MSSKDLLSSSDAIKLIKQNKYSKFDESLELHINVADIGFKGEIELPFSNGKTTRVVVANDSVVEELEKGTINFDVLVTTAAFMPKLTKFARLLGPKGLMPNPKNGTITNNPDEVVKKLSGNTLRYKTEPKAPIVHLTVGKLSLADDNLVANIKTIIDSMPKSQIKSAFICGTMSPSLQISI